MSSFADTVKLIYPNDWRRNVSDADRQSCKFCWFMCSHRVLDEKTGLYYADISPNVQFFKEETGESFSARGLSEGSVAIRPKLLILSDPHNKIKLCGTYGYMCGCDSKRDVLSRNCSLTKNKDVLFKGVEWALQNGYDGAVILHVDLGEHNSLINPVCQNATFIFKKGILKSVTSDNSQRCNIVKYSKKNNTYIRSILRMFPTCQEIEQLLKDNTCQQVSKLLYHLLVSYKNEK
jgi:hypothetical protein